MTAVIQTVIINKCKYINSKILNIIVQLLTYNIRLASSGTPRRDAIIEIYEIHVPDYNSCNCIDIVISFHYRLSN